MISANTLFHFTKTLDNIKNILTNNFSPRYCLERIDFLSQNGKLDLAIPMICFCDIPLSQIINHVITYGDYAIGLGKDWAIKNGISPVLYLYNDSRTNRMLNSLFISSARIDMVKRLIKKDETFQSSLDFMEFLFYCKIYKGDMWRDNKLVKKITFYDEREWRYVPNIQDLESINPRLIINKAEHNDFRVKQDYNEQLRKYQLKFTPTDIKYIIIKNESERLEMIRMIEDIKGSDFFMNDLKVLNSKIISIEQIKDDF
ncbi:abortive infection system antitoxin AbiGi family protein [uncultured Algoriphagus sp.]|uniref:abortive infection system antitoxin AbiGi family protein n=1 Tax=uncultured Algoriphagus sp. TaxID=417365 RepID=UPI0030EF25CB|tara:strand:+ start:187 stop:960 length:774 start_codon:yes stop_codon:yes gene_type:complete